MRLGAWVFASALLVGSLGTRSARADGVILIDRIVAVVDDTIITLAELDARVKLDLTRLAPAEREANRATLRRATLDMLVDRQLIANDARRRGVEVSGEEVDRAERLVAAEAHVSVTELEAQAKAAGFEAPAYRAELSYQLLEAKWLRATPDWAGPRPAGNPSPEEQDRWLATKRAALLKELRASSHVDVRR